MKVRTHFYRKKMGVEFTGEFATSHGKVLGEFKWFKFDMKTFATGRPVVGGGPARCISLRRAFGAQDGDPAMRGCGQFRRPTTPTGQGREALLQAGTLPTETVLSPSAA